MASEDTRIVYGATCTWWDSIHKIGLRSSLPCCPKCRGMLFEMNSEKIWWKNVEAHESAGNPGYRKLIEWARGKCFRDMKELTAAYASGRNDDYANVL